MALKNNVLSIPISTINVAGLVLGIWTPFPRPLPNACFMIRILNRSNTNVFVSYDGVNYNDAVLADTEFTYPFQQFSRPSGNVSWLKEGSVVWITGAAGAGFVYLCGYYQESQ